MIAKHLAAAAVTTALLVGGAYAQTGATSSPSSTTSSSVAARVHQEGDWRASKLPGVSIYNENNEKIGSINDVIIDKSGKAVAVILGVGGFLGMGEHYVSVAFDQLKWSNEPVRTASSSTSAPATNVDSTSRTASDNSRMTTGAATSTRSEDMWYPDHAVLNATKDQLKAMPEFKY